MDNMEPKGLEEKDEEIEDRSEQFSVHEEKDSDDEAIEREISEAEKSSMQPPRSEKSSKS